MNDQIPDPEVFDLRPQIICTFQDLNVLLISMIRYISFEALAAISLSALITFIVVVIFFPDLSYVNIVLLGIIISSFIVTVAKLFDSHESDAEMTVRIYSSESPIEITRYSSCQTDHADLTMHPEVIQPPYTLGGDSIIDSVELHSICKLPKICIDEYHYPELKRFSQNFIHQINLKSRDLLVPNTFKSWLMKEGSQGKSWKRRYFVLEKGNMIYFRNNSEEEQLGRYKLKNFALISDSDGESSYSRRIILDRKSKDISVKLEAESIEDRNNWVRCINQHIIYLQTFD